MKTSIHLLARKSVFLQWYITSPISHNISFFGVLRGKKMQLQRVATTTNIFSCKNPAHQIAYLCFIKLPGHDNLGLTVMKNLAAEFTVLYNFYSIRDQL